MKISTNDNEINQVNTSEFYSIKLVEKMCRGSRELLKEMLEVFIVDLPKALEDIKSAYKDSDFKKIKNIAHRVKPVLKFYDVQCLEKDLPVMEELAEQNTALPELECLIDKMDWVISAIVCDMKKTILAM